MNTIISCVVLAALCLSVQAAPARSTVQLYKSLTEASTPFEIDSWSICSASSDPAKVLSITITPDPPKKSMDLTLTAEFTLEEEVTGGDIEIKLKKGVIPVKQTEKLCDVLKQTGKSCPLEKGTQTLSVTQKIPSFAPKGHYTGKAYVRDQNGKELVCIALDFNLE